MSEDQIQKIIDKAVREYATYSHQTKGNEFSDIVADFKTILNDFGEKIVELEKRAVRWDIGTHLVFALAGLILTSAIVAIVNLII